MAKRRERGEGSIFFDEAKGLFVGILSLGKSLDGKRDRRTIYAKTKPELVVKLRELRKTAKLNQPATSSQSFGDYLDFWLNAIRVAGCKPKTHECYARTARKHIKPYLGMLPLDSLTAYHAHQLFSRLEAAGASKYTQRYAHRVVRSALSYAVEPLKALPANPFFGIKSPKHTPRKMSTWTPEQCNMFLASVTEHRYYVAFVLAIDLGMREGEILALNWPDVDFSNGVLRVEATLQTENGRILGRGDPKTQSSKRTLPLTPRCVAALKQQRGRMMARGHAASPWVVPTVRGGPVNPSNFIRAYRKAALKLDLGYIRPHELRHSHATILVQAGVDPKTVAERLGHSSVTTTLQTYVHSDLAQQRKVTERFSRIMEGKE